MVSPLETTVWSMVKDYIRIANIEDKAQIRAGVAAVDTAD